MPRPLVGIIGSGKPTPSGYQAARQVGKLLAEQGLAVVCGGLEGIMEAASRGCSEAGGTVIGLLPGAESVEGNPYLTYALPTNLGHARNVLIAHASYAVIAVEGEYGTLSEIAISLKLGRTVVGLGCPWDIPGLKSVDNAPDAVEAVTATLKGLV